MKRLLTYSLIFLLLNTSLAFAGTRIWEQVQAKDFEPGEFKGTLLAADGTVQVGFELQKIKCTDFSLWSSVYDANGNLYLGTGTKGIIYSLQEKQLVEFAKTGTLMVTSLVIVGDCLYAATIPEGKIFQINLTTKETKLWLKLPANYIWGLVQYGDSLLAATGPDGILYRLNLANPQPDAWVKTNEKHILSMAVDEQQNIYLGTEPNALLLQVKNDGNATVLADLPENEIRSLAIQGSKIYLGANTTKNFDHTKVVQNLARELEQQGQQGKPVNRKELLQKITSGMVYEYQAETGYRSLFSLPKNFITVLTPYQQGVLCGAGMDGYVYHIVSKDKVTLLCDLRDDQVTTLIIKQGSLQAIGTGDSGILYCLLSPPTNIQYFSPVLDASGLANWGRISWQKTGNLILQTRSGNTQIPDTFWNDWVEANNGKIQSKPARYLQYRVLWPQPQTQIEAGQVEAVRVYYTTVNRSPTISNFKLEGPKEDNSRLFSSKTEKKLKFSWKGEDEDKDELRFRLYYRNVETSYWVEITNNEILTKPTYTWDTSNVADGYYLLRLVASDEFDNVIPLEEIYTTRPILLDNHAPIIKIQKQEGSNTITGKVEDAGLISQIAYRVGIGEWKIIAPIDGLCDDSQEEFSIEIPDAAPATIEIKASDSNGNTGAVLVK